MNIEQLTFVYFSPAGHTKQVCEYLAEQFPLPSELLDVTAASHHAPSSYGETNLIVFAVPSFGGRVPAIALEKFKELQGNQTPCILLTSYGNRDYDDTLLELKNTVEPLGFSPIAAMAVVCEHSIMHVYGTNRPDAQDKAQLQSFVSQIMQKLTAATALPFSPLQVKGNFPYKEYGGIPLKPHATKKCISCGICAKECPVEAIDPQHPDHTDKTRCISCMRCITICPQHAREVNSIMVKASILKLKKECIDRKDNDLYLS